MLRPKTPWLQALFPGYKALRVAAAPWPTSMRACRGGPVLLLPATLPGVFIS
jgi:hypothetical protein